MEAAVSELATVDTVTAALAERVMGWRAAPDRFLKSGRAWIPRWRFQPFQNIEDALALLDAAKPQQYEIRGAAGQVTAHVNISGSCGECVGTSRAAVLSGAIAAALGICAAAQVKAAASMISVRGEKEGPNTNG